MLFRVGNTDYTTSIIQGTYKINSTDVYKEWTDANFCTHRHVFRSKAEGSFTMYFGNQQEFESFLTDMNSVKNDYEGYYIVGLWSNNTHTFNSTARAFIEMNPTREQKIIGEAWFPELTLKVEEV